jgi:hypothetical protein
MPVGRFIATNALLSSMRKVPLRKSRRDLAGRKSASLYRTRLAGQSYMASVKLWAGNFVDRRIVHSRRPSSNDGRMSVRLRAIRYGPDSCRQTLEIFDRFVQVRIGPKYTPRINDHIIDAIRQAHDLVA